jgi:glycine/D-amino acid oxidase-like deaminating enzyme
MHDVIVIGAGIFGTTAAIELQRRGYRTMLTDPGPLPHPLAASTDISKVIRMEYGADAQYMAMIEQAIPGWRRWNEELEEPLFHETGVSMLTRTPMVDGGFEYESYQMLLKRGHRPERLQADDIPRRFPAWKPGAYVDGFFHAIGGFAESGRVVAALIQRAQDRGVTLIEGQSVQDILQSSGRVTGVRTDHGTLFHAQHVVVAAGAWTHTLIPDLAPTMRATGHPVFHLRIADPVLFTSPHFSVFTADINHTGWYGFPAHPREGVIKIANHGVGQRLDPQTDARVVTDQDEINLRRFLVDTFPTIQQAEVVYTRRCLYSDTLDEHFWIDHHPEVKGLVIASGGSGHGFKFAPLLGPLIADALEHQPNPWLPNFRWRTLTAETKGEEAARFHG